MKLYSMGILEFNYSSLIEYLFNFCEVCTLCCLENLNRRIFFFLVAQFIWVSGLFPISGIMNWEELNNFQGY